MSLEENLHHSAQKKGLSGEDYQKKSEAGSGDRYEEKKAERANKRAKEAEKYKKQREESARKEQEFKQQEYAKRVEKEQHARDLRELTNVRRRVHGMVQSAKKYHPDVEAEGKRLVEAGKLKGDESTMTKKDYDAWIRFFHKHRIYT
jgi:hypothetical protein